METSGDAADLAEQHKRERKELQNKIQALKKTAIKGDKKKKKEVQEEIVRLETELDNKHKTELEQAEKNKETSTNNDNDVITGIEELSVESVETKGSGSRVTKAQKRRDKKAAEQKERQKRILEQEIENENSQRTLEIQKISENLKKRKLMLHEIISDGNCLYNAVDHQLKLNLGFNLGVDQLRLKTSNIIRNNIGDYLPFLSDPSTGDILTEEQVLEYCEKVATTTNWGGQVELQALSHVVQHPIEVVQAEGPSLIMGEDYDNPVLILTYHRHMYKLGEHYNSVKPFVEENE